MLTIISIKLPALDRMVDTARYHDWQCMMHRNRGHKMWMGIVNCTETAFGLDIKDSYRPIVSGANDEVACRVDQNTSYPIFVRIEGNKARSLADRPKPDRAVTSARCHEIIQLLSLFIRRALSAIRSSTPTSTATT